MPRTATAAHAILAHKSAVVPFWFCSENSKRSANYSAASLYGVKLEFHESSFLVATSKNLQRGRLATAHNFRTQSFNRICPVAPMCMFHLILRNILADTPDILARMSRGCYEENAPVEFQLKRPILTGRVPSSFCRLSVCLSARQ